MKTSRTHSRLLWQLPCVVMLAAVLACCAKAQSKEPARAATAEADQGEALRQKLVARGLPATAKMEDQSEGLAVFINIEKKAADDYDPDIVSLWTYDQQTDRLTKLLTTLPTDDFSWVMAATGKAVGCNLSDIHAIFEAHVIPYTRKILVCGCPDMRNIYSYIIDTEKRTALCLPTNSSFGGFTPEEDFILMYSYAYNTATFDDGTPVGGRHTFISVFDHDGKRVGTLDLDPK